MLRDLFVVAAVGVVLATSYALQRARTRTIDETLRRYGVEPLPARDGAVFALLWGPVAIEGRVRDLKLRYELGPGGRAGARRTICDVWLAAPTELEMDVRPETPGEVADVAHGRAIDLAMGDEAFDDSFVVEAAPSALASAVLDRNVRTALLAFHPCVVRVRGNHVSFSKGTLLDEAPEIARVLDLCLGVADGLRTLPGKLAEERLAVGLGLGADGYRGPTPEAIRALARSPEDAKELEVLHQAQAKRRRFTLGESAAIVVALIVAAVALAMMRGR